MDKKISIRSLSFEMSRRCNLKCDWCSKGECENVDITKEIIDKALNEVQQYPIREIRITGGEPFINSEMIVYLLKQLIKKNIIFYDLFILSNGMYCDKNVAYAIKDVLEYMKKNESIRKKISTDAFIGYKFEYYDKNFDGKLFMQISTFEHTNQSVVDDTIKFYKEQINDDWFYITKQSNEYDLNNSNIRIMIEGRAEKSFQKYSPEILKYIRIIDNHYNIIDDENYPNIIIRKMLQICANGNLWLGDSSSYKHEDEYAICNIRECNNNLYEILDNWCWNNPNSRKIKHTYESYLSQKWLKDNGLISKDITNAFNRIGIETIIEFYQKLHRRLHKDFPYLNHTEIQNATIDGIYSELLFNSTQEQREIFLFLFSDYDEDAQKRLANDVQFAKSAIDNKIAEYELTNAKRQLEQTYKIYEAIMNYSKKIKRRCNNI